MAILYKIGIWATLVVGIIHCALTSHFYGGKGESTFWFFAGGLALILTALLNYINLAQTTRLTAVIALLANTAACSFLIALSVYLPEIHIMAATVIFLIPFACSLVYVRKIKEAVTTLQ